LHLQYCSCCLSCCILTPIAFACELVNPDNRVIGFWAIRALRLLLVEHMEVNDSESVRAFDNCSLASWILPACWWLLTFADSWRIPMLRHRHLRQFFCFVCSQSILLTTQTKCLKAYHGLISKEQISLLIC
jgi:hypothetical protein